MREQRISQLEALTDVVSKMFDANRALVADGSMTEEMAKARSIKQLLALTYGNGDYFFICDENGVYLAHPDARVIGKNFMGVPDANGFKWTADVVPRAVRDGVATVNYTFKRVGSEVLAPKMAVYRYYPPWHWVIVTGTWIDDMIAVYEGAAMALAVVAAGLLIVLLGAATFLIRTIVRPTTALSASMLGLAAGDMDCVVPSGGSLAETRSMAKALGVFKSAGIQKSRLEKEAAEQRQAAEALRTRSEADREEATASQRAVVNTIAAALARLSAGDLTVRLPDAFPVDYEELRKDFNAATQQLQSAIGVITTNTAALRSGTAQITQAADDMSRRTEQQAASLEETAAALEQITTTVRRTAEGAVQASTVVTSTKADAERSSTVVQDAVESMTAIETSARQVSQIVGVIDEIAFQTNLLALNAGVEAARAGDAGRGFAVVASEVRALAQRSAESAREIKALISTSSQQVDRGVRLVAETGVSLDRILTQVRQIDEVVTEIAAGAQEQAKGLMQVNTAINQMDQATQQNAAMVEESAAASHSLSQETESLVQLTSHFKIAEAGDLTDVATIRPRRPPVWTPALQR